VLISLLLDLAHELHGPSASRIPIIAWSMFRRCRDSLFLLAALLERAGQRVGALNSARRLYELEPRNSQVQQMLKSDEHWCN
jgi:hypothetical protein